MARPSLFTNRKFYALSARLGSQALAVGTLELIWRIGYENGDPMVGGAVEIEYAVGWKGETGALVAMLLETGFLDKHEDGFEIHDFWDHAPTFVKKRRSRELERRENGNSLRLTSQRPVSDRSVTGQCPPNGHTPAPAPAPAPNKEKTTSSSSSGDDAFLKNVLDFWESSNLTPACRALSKARRSSILARRKEHGEAAVFEVLKNRKDSNFLTFVFSDGRGAGIDWVFGPKNFVKILDGTYNDAPRSADQTDEMTMTFRRLAQKFGCTAEDMKAYWDKEGATPTTKEQVDRFLEVPF